MYLCPDIVEVFGIYVRTIQYTTFGRVLVLVGRDFRFVNYGQNTTPVSVSRYRPLVQPAIIYTICRTTSVLATLRYRGNGTQPVINGDDVWYYQGVGIVVSI